MKLKENYILRQLADSWVVIALSSAVVDLNGMLTLNESGALLWHALEKGADRNKLIDIITGEYVVDRTLAAADVDEFLEKLIVVGCLDPEE